MEKILVILGPTSTGKTDLALKLAEEFNGELVACDSRQVYKGLDIGTGKTPSGIFNLFFKLPLAEQFSIFKKEKCWEINGIKIWLYDVISPKKQYTVYHYVQDAKKVIDDIVKRGKLPIVVGGTGLYLKALVEGLPSLAIPTDPKLRKKLEKLSLHKLQEMLQRISPGRWEKMNSSDRRNSRRLVRAIELVMLQPQRIKQLELRIKDFNILKIGLTAPREVLYKKINDKVLKWIEEGIVDEVKRLIKEGVTKKRIKNLGLEYAIVIEYLDKKISPDQMIDKMQNKIRQYAKRQITWFKNPSTGSGCIIWFDITEKGYLAGVENLVGSWYDWSKA